MTEPLHLVGRAFLARSSRRIDATLSVSGGIASLSDETGAVVLEFPVHELRLETALGSADRRATLPDGTLFETGDHVSVENLTGFSLSDKLSKAERFHPRLILVIAAAMAGVFLIWRFALPALVWIAVAMTPEPLKDAIDSGTLAAIDRTLANPSDVGPGRRAEIKGIFSDLINELPAESRGDDFALEFRSIPGIGPNAAALPGGTILLTDELVEGFPDDDIIAAVIGHELGHVVEQHGLSQLYRSLGVFILVTLIAGDTGPILEDVLLEGNVILSLSFSRTHERQADQFGLRLTEAAGYDPAGLIAFFEALPDSDQTESGWKSTHPASGERIEAIRDFLNGR